MVQEFIAYIDEAGDEGFGKLRNEGVSGQSRWLALGASIVSVENDRFVPSWRDEIMGLFPAKRTRDLHFRTLSHDQRVAACGLLATKQLGVCVVLSNKETLLDSPKMSIFKQKGHLYHYLVRFLLERLTTACKVRAARDNDVAKLRVVFSRRAGTDYQAMREYLVLMRDGKERLPPVRSVLWDVLTPDDIGVENHSVRAGLQLADVVTSATCCALEPNRYGNCEPRYASTLESRYIRSRGSVHDCGITLIPKLKENPLSEEQKRFLVSIR